MAEKGAWLFKSQTNGSGVEGLRKQLKVCPFPIRFPPKPCGSLRKNTLSFQEEVRKGTLDSQGVEPPSKGWWLEGSSLREDRPKEVSGEIRRGPQTPR